MTTKKKATTKNTKKTPAKKAAKKKVTKKVPVKKRAKKTVKVAKKTTKKAPAKKKAKKTVAKKVSTKKKIKKRTEKKPFARKVKLKTKARPKVAPEEKRFWTNDGAILKDLFDLHKELLSMNKEQFAYHAKGELNHFAIWVEVVLCEPVCAKDLKKAKTQKTAAKKVDDALKKYK